LKSINRMNYINSITSEINSVLSKPGTTLLFGENINVGSCLSGLARGLKPNSHSKILNVGNCELTHIGVGFGIMADGGNSVLFMKQSDFLLLGVDQIVNTYNYFRSFSSPADLGSFTIYLIVCDQGFQGPQSSLNSLSDISSLANIPIFCLNAKDDISNIIGAQFISSGFRIISVSQRLFSEASIEPSLVAMSADAGLFKYQSGADITLACYNFSLRHGLDLASKLKLKGIHADLFHINYIPGMDLSLLKSSLMSTHKLVILDDSKGLVKFGDMHCMMMLEAGINFSPISISRRGGQPEEYGVTNDLFTVDLDLIDAFLNDLP